MIDKFRRRALGFSVIFFGLWEALAFATGRVPTITRFVHSCSSKWRVTRFLVGAWLLFLGKHLLVDKSDHL